MFKSHILIFILLVVVNNVENKKKTGIDIICDAIDAASQLYFQYSHPIVSGISKLLGGFFEYYGEIGRKWNLKKNKIINETIIDIKNKFNNFKLNESEENRIEFWKKEKIN